MCKGWIGILLFGWIAGTGLTGQPAVPERTFAGQTLEIPPAQLDQGLAYYVWPGEDAQLTFRSEAPFQKVLVTSNRVIGYLLAPFELEEGEKPLLSGAFRIPASSLQAHLDNLDDTLGGPAFLDAANHPELAFQITSVQDVEQLEKNETLTRYALRIEGKATLKGKQHDLSFPAQLTFRPYTTFVTRNPGVGDSLILTARFPLKLQDYGWTPPRSLHLRLAEEIPVEVYLLLNTILPDKSGDPRRDPDKHSKQQRFVTLVRDLNDTVQAYAFGRGLLKEFWEEAEELHLLAQALVSTPGVQRRDLGFALEAVQRAVELSQQRDGSILATLARVHYERGEMESAVEWQGKAVDLLQESQPRLAAQASQSLTVYKAEAEASRAQKR